MIDNKDKYLNQKGLFYRYKDIFTKKQTTFFNLVEKKKIKSIINIIVKQVNNHKPKKYIRKPLIQLIFVKIYVLIFR